MRVFSSNILLKRLIYYYILHTRKCEHTIQIQFYYGRRLYPDQFYLNTVTWFWSCIQFICSNRFHSFQLSDVIILKKKAKFLFRFRTHINCQIGDIRRTDFICQNYNTLNKSTKQLLYLNYSYYVLYS